MDLVAPLYVVWETTLDCNARCVHCYSDAILGRSAPDRWWPTKDALDLIDQLADIGVLILALSGGEVLLRHDWEHLVRRGVGRGMRVTLATNGLCVTPAVARRLHAAGVWNVTISLDGARAETHDAVRGQEGVFDAACRAVRLLESEGVRTTVNFTPMRTNRAEALDVIDLAEDLGASKINMTEYVYLSRGGLDLMLRPEELRAVMADWMAAAKARRGRIEVDWHDCRVALLVDPEEADKYSGCGAGYTHCRITADRDVTPCVVLPVAVGNLRQSRFQDIWSSAPELRKIRDRGSIESGNCSDCAHKARCGGCRAVSFAVHGHPYGGDATCWIVPEKHVSLPLIH